MKKVFAAFVFLFCFGMVQAKAVDLPILMYHSVDDTGGMYTVTEEKLESDITGLKNAGYTTVSFDEVIANVHMGEPLPEKPVVISFDDGYENNCSVLLPLAERLDFKFEVFTVAGFINYGEHAMKWEQVAKVNNSLHGGMGCHTYNMHSYAGDGRWGVVRKEGEEFRDWENIFRSDLNMAKNLFMDNTGYTPRTFAYPQGNFNAETDRILREEGYLLTVTTEPGINRVEIGDYESLYMMMRISMDGQKASALDMIKSCSNIYYSERIANAKINVWSEVNASRGYALNALFGKRFEDEEYNPDFISSYKDLKYSDKMTRRLFAKCVEQGIVTGFPDFTMRPNHYITRGEFAVILARSFGYNGEEATHFYTDSKEWNAGELSWCYDKGYMIGYGDEFGVNDFLTKEQVELVCKRIWI